MVRCSGRKRKRIYFMSEFRDLADNVAGEGQKLMAGWEDLASQWRDPVASKIAAEYMLPLFDLIEACSRGLAALDAAVNDTQTSGGELS